MIIIKVYNIDKDSINNSKGEKMKEKLSAILTIGFIFSLFFYYKVINPIENNIGISSINQNKEILKVEVIEDDNINLIDEIAIDKTEDHCSLDIENTDLMDFSSAFKYYRKCNGSNSTFSWNKNLYSTVLLSEVNPGDKNQVNNNGNLMADFKILLLEITKV